MQRPILVIDDEPDVRTMLELVLTEYGFPVLTAPDALIGLRLAYQERPSAVILDVVLPGMDGFEACRRLREMTDIPILLLTGRETAPEAVVKGFDLGADEYITKPFSTPELIGRLKGCLRRAARSSDDGANAFYFAAPKMVLDGGRHELLLDGRSIPLSPNEYGVLQLLVRHEGRTLSSDAILSQVWGPERIGETRLVKQYIYQLRQKVEPNPALPQYIHTVRGEGYYFLAT